MSTDAIELLVPVLGSLVLIQIFRHHLWRPLAPSVFVHFGVHSIAYNYGRVSHYVIGIASCMMMVMVIYDDGIMIIIIVVEMSCF